MSSHNSAINMIGGILQARHSSGKPRSRYTHNNGDDEQIIPILCLLAADILAGVGLQSIIRSFVKSHVPLIEFSTGVEFSVNQQLEQPEQLLHSREPQSIQKSTLDVTQQNLVIEVHGLKNRGNTCYANSILQALASLEPLYKYLESLAHQKSNSDSVIIALFQTLQYVNGHDPYGAKSRGGPSPKPIIPFIRFFSSSYHVGDPQKVMNLVAKHHSQFRSRNSMGMAGTLEQQDSHEFFSALMDVLSTEDKNEGESDLRNNTINTTQQSGWGLACFNSVDNFNESNSDGEVDELKGEQVASSDLVADEFEEEKKHDEHIGVADLPFSDGSSVKQAQEATQHNTCPILNNENRQSTRRSTGNPFDGWYGSTVKCASCRHIRPIRSAPFLGLSLPIANIQSEFLEDFLAAEYGGFATAERVQDVQCFACSIKQKLHELEEEELLLNGAISSVQRRKRAQKTAQNGGKVDDDTAGLLEEHQQLKRKIAILEGIDPDAVDDDKIECNEGKDTQQEIDLGIGSLLPPITPSRGDAFKAMLLMRPPEVLCIHIQRRHYDISCQRMVKIMRHVHFDEELDLGSYCAYSNGGRIPYKLMSVIEHMGSAFGGHYQTYRRVDPHKNDWVLVSDEHVSQRSWNDVKRCQAYMLFYVASSNTL